MGSQDERRRDVARVPGVASDGLRRDVEAIIVVVNGDHGRLPLHDHRAAPAVPQRRDGCADEQLHGMGARGGVGEIAQAEGPLVCGGVEKRDAHGVLP